MKARFKKFLKNQKYKIVLHPKTKKTHKPFIRVLFIPFILFNLHLIANWTVKTKFNKTYPWEESVKIYMKTVINKKKQKNPRYRDLFSL